MWSRPLSFQVDARIAEEAERARHYLHPSTESRITKVREGMRGGGGGRSEEVEGVKMWRVKGVRKWRVEVGGGGRCEEVKRWRVKGVRRWKD